MPTYRHTPADDPRNPMDTTTDTTQIAGHPLTPVTPFGVRIDAAHPGTPITDLPVARLRELAREHHLLLLRGFTAFTNADELTAYSAQWGEIAMWPYGAVLELVEHDNPDDHIFDHRYVPMHWDSMYREQIAQFQVFHCVSAPGIGNGGRTTFTQTEAVLRDADPAHRELWEKATGRYRRAVSDYVGECVSPVVTTHPDGFPIIRYNEPPVGEDFLNRPDLEFTGIPAEQLPEFHRTLNEALYNPRHLYAHTWQTGDVVIADNYTLLHGREAFTSRSPRHLQRVHVLGTPPLENTALTHR
ncbi:TauD/TfdA dioxygenase family protein [Streptomyces ehimensis]|uniref:TauD/TfdA dioxygenase family protein n=1 Tax=Streptomyces ehimensis TaxID=68195 RepID=A0ABV9BB94_9ACTN